MLIAVDAMGGDHAPLEVCKGALEAVGSFEDLEIVLVGQLPRLNEVFQRELQVEVPSRVHLEHAEEFIGMDEQPAMAFRRKRRSSLRVAAEMLKSGQVDGVVSAGNTGAVVAAGVLVVGRIEGVHRPGLGIPTPALERVSFVIDVGATVECEPLDLYQFALMGSLYMENVFGVKEPSVALLSNGEEEIKGGELISKAREMLASSRLNFAGYAEGKDIPFGKFDVVVCDGFTGNVLLKFVEGVGEALHALFKAELLRRKFSAALGLLFLKPILRDVLARLDYERYGGAPLLGVKGAVIKAHGRSRHRAIASAIRVARETVLRGLPSRIEAGLEWR